MSLAIATCTFHYLRRHLHSIKNGACCQWRHDAVVFKWLKINLISYHIGSCKSSVREKDKTCKSAVTEQQNINAMLSLSTFKPPVENHNVDVYSPATAANHHSRLMHMTLVKISFLNWKNEIAPKNVKNNHFYINNRHYECKIYFHCCATCSYTVC